MYTHEITSVKYQDGNVLATVHFTDGTTSFDKTFIPTTLTQLKKTIQSQLNISNTGRALVIPLGVLDLDIPPDPPIVIDPPSQHDLDLRDYSEKRQKLINIKQNLDMGLDTQEEFDTALTLTLAAKDKLK